MIAIITLAFTQQTNIHPIISVHLSYHQSIVSIQHSYQRIISLTLTINHFNNHYFTYLLLKGTEINPI